MVVMVVVVVEYLKMSIRTSIADAVRRDRSEMRKSIGEMEEILNDMHNTCLITCLSLLIWEASGLRLLQEWIEN